VPKKAKASQQANVVVKVGSFFVKNEIGIENLLFFVLTLLKKSLLSAKGN